MITKTFVAAALIAGLASTSAMSAPKRSNTNAAERAATRQLNEQQLASAGSYAATPAPASPSAAPAMEAQPAMEAPATGMTPPATTTPPAADPMAPAAPPQ